MYVILDNEPVGDGIIFTHDERDTWLIFTEKQMSNKMKADSRWLIGAANTISQRQ